MNFVGVKPKKTIFFPDRLYETRYTGEIWGKHFEKSKVFNIFSHEKSDLYSTECLGVIHSQKPEVIPNDSLTGWWEEESLQFRFDGEEYACQNYNLVQNIFSRNTGIL